MVSEEYSCRQHTIWQIALLSCVQDNQTYPLRKKLLDGLYMEKMMMVEKACEIYDLI